MDRMNLNAIYRFIGGGRNDALATLDAGVLDHNAGAAHIRPEKQPTLPSSS